MLIKTKIKVTNFFFKIQTVKKCLTFPYLEPLEYAVFPEEGPQKYTDFNVVKQKLNGFMTEVSRSEVQYCFLQYAFSIMCAHYIYNIACLSCSIMQRHYEAILLQCKVERSFHRIPANIKAYIL